MGCILWSVQSQSAKVHNLLASLTVAPIVLVVVICSSVVLNSVTGISVVAVILVVGTFTHKKSCDTCCTIISTKGCISAILRSNSPSLIQIFLSCSTIHLFKSLKITFTVTFVIVSSRMCTVNEFPKRATGPNIIKISVMKTNTIGIFLTPEFTFTNGRDILCRT